MRKREARTQSEHPMDGPPREEGVRREVAVVSRDDDAIDAVRARLEEREAGRARSNFNALGRRKVPSLVPLSLAHKLLELKQLGVVEAVSCEAALPPLCTALGRTSSHAIP